MVNSEWRGGRITHPGALRPPFPMLRPGHSAQEGIGRGVEGIGTINFTINYF